MSSAKRNVRLDILGRFGRRFDPLSEAVLTLDDEGLIAQANPAAECLFGAVGGSLRGRRVHELLHLPEEAFGPSDGRRLLQIIAQSVTGGEFAAEVSISRHAVSGDQTTAIIIVVRDLRDLQHIIHTTAHQARLATIGEAVTRIVHNLLNSLTGIGSLVEDLLETARETDEEPLELVLSETGRATAMVRSLLEFSRRDKEVPLVSLNTIVARVTQLCARSCRGDQCEILVEQQDGQEICLIGSPTQLTQILMNLIENARYAVKNVKDARIAVRTWVDEQNVKLEVSDNGRGIPPEIVNRIFDPFFTTKEPGSGTGLGLAYVESAVHELGGAIAVNSLPGVGTKFVLSFPRAG